MPVPVRRVLAEADRRRGADRGRAGRGARWRSAISHVAAQEMLHLALVHNLLTAIGAAPHLARPNLPQPASHYPAGRAAGAAAVRRAGAAALHVPGAARGHGPGRRGRAEPPSAGPGALLQRARHRPARPGLRHGRPPVPVDRGGLRPPGRDSTARTGCSSGRRGRRRPRSTSAGRSWSRSPTWPARSAPSTTILEQGEGPRGHWRDAHFGQFVAILDEYQQLRAADPDFEPGAPGHRRPTSGRPSATPTCRSSAIRSPRGCADLFNVVYEILLQILSGTSRTPRRPTPSSQTLADATVALMLRVIRPLGDLITTLPGRARTTPG